MDHSKKAEELFLSGYNCAQAVFCAFCDLTGFEIEAAAKLASSFGGGFGRLREVCGAVSGAFMVAGLKYGYSDPADKTAKTEHYKLIQDMAAKFKEENGSIICRELLEVGDEKETHVPEDRTKEYYKKRPCAQLVETAAKIAEEFLN